MKSCIDNHSARFSIVATFAFLFLLAHAIIAGHIFFGTQVPIVAAAILALGILNLNERHESV